MPHSVIRRVAIAEASSVSSIPIGRQGYRLVEHGNHSHQYTTLSVPLEISPHFATTIAHSGLQVEGWDFHFGKNGNSAR